MTLSFDKKAIPAYLGSGRFSSVAGVMDQAPPWLLQKLVPLLSGRVMIDAESVNLIRELSKQGPVVYAIKFPSSYDLQFLRMKFNELGLAIPWALLGAVDNYAGGSVLKWLSIWKDKVKKIFTKGKTADPLNAGIVLDIFEHDGACAFYLVDESTSRDRYLNPEKDPISLLLEVQGKIAAPISIVPLFILYDRRHKRQIRPFWETLLGDSDRPGPIGRILIAIRKWTVPELMVGEPVNLIGEFEEFGSDVEWDDLPFTLRTKLIERINSRIRINRGAEKLSRTEIKELVLQDKNVQEAVSVEAVSKNEREEKIRKKAEAYVDEIAADQRIQMYHFLYYVLKLLFKTLFDRVDYHESDFAKLKKYNEKGSLIFVSSHKSHFDYLFLGFLSFIHQMTIPCMAAGKNLAFWPLRPILRSGGAFFLRRSLKGLELYTRVFAAYVKVLVREKTNLNFYIEGGRSRTGKLLAPKLGLLSFLLDVAFEGEFDDLTFVPCYVGYDQIPEEKSYLSELAGHEKEKESFRSLLSSRKIFGKRYGTVYLRFHEPISFREFCEQRVGFRPLPELTMPERRELTHDFAYYIMSSMIEASAVNAIELSSAAVICEGSNEFSHDQLVESAARLAYLLESRGVQVTDSCRDVNVALDESLGLFMKRKFLIFSPETGLKDRMYAINPERLANIEFYKNTLVNSLWPCAITATVIIAANTKGSDITPDSMVDDFSFLESLLSLEFIADPLVSNAELVKNCSQYFSNAGWLKDHGSHFEVVDEKAVKAVSYLIRDLTSVYYLALLALDGLDAGPVSQKEFMKSLAKRMEITDFHDEQLKPTLPSVTVNNALNRFGQMELIDFVPQKKVINRLSDPNKREMMVDRLGRLAGMIR